MKKKDIAKKMSATDKHHKQINYARKLGRATIYDSHEEYQNNLKDRIKEEKNKDNRKELKKEYGATLYKKIYEKE